MAEWGGTDAESLKCAIDNIFDMDKGVYPLTNENYRTKLVSVTADGASVNTGRLSGLMTRLGEEREWLVKIHCINHRVELAVKDALVDSVFKEIDSFYLTNFYLMRGSGKIKSEVEKACGVLKIQHYTLPKMSGTRFVGHRRRALTNLLSTWPAFIMAYENVEADRKTQPQTKAKIQGLLKNFKSYRYITLACCYLDLLEKIVPASKVFEGELLLPFEIDSAIKTSETYLKEYSEGKTDENDIDSHLHRYFLVPSDDGSYDLKGYFDSPGDQLKLLVNRKQVEINFNQFQMTNVSQATIEAAQKARANAAKDLIVLRHKP